MVRSPGGPVVATALAAFAIAACGGDDPGGEEAVTASWADLRTAIDEGDGAAACARLGESLAAPGGLNQQFGLPQSAGATCEELVEEPAINPILSEGMAAELEDVTIDGETASGDAGAARPTFAAEDGEWKVTSFFGAPPEE